MIKTLLKKWHVAVISSICIVVALALAAWTPFRNQSKDILVKNQTQALQVVSARKEGDNIQLRLKNISNKDINGYTLSLSDGETITQDYTEGDFVFAPGKIEEDIIPAATSLSSGASALEQNINILAVVFTDNSSEGGVKAAAEIKDRRRGVKKQLSHILPLLKNTLSVSDINLPTALRELKSQILSLPERPESGSSRAIGFGMYDAKQDILLVIEKIERSQQNQPLTTSKEIREQLMNALENSERRVSKL